MGRAIDIILHRGQLLLVPYKNMEKNFWCSSLYTLTPYLPDYKVGTLGHNVWDDTCVQVSFPLNHQPIGWDFTYVMKKIPWKHLYLKSKLLVVIGLDGGIWLQFRLAGDVVIIIEPITRVQLSLVWHLKKLSIDVKTWCKKLTANCYCMYCRVLLHIYRAY